MVVSIPELEYYDATTGTNVITKEAAAGRIKITDSYGGEMFASVSGNSYVYEKATITENIEGTTITEEMTGSGVKNGTTISGTGVIKFHAYGETFTGTWTCTLVKK